MTDKSFIVSKTIVEWLLLYNFTVWLIFSITYRSIDFPKHFDVPPTFQHTLDTSMFYAFMIQTQMYGTDIVAKTPTGRALVAVQGVMAWGQTIVFLAPWLAISAVRKPTT
jgi:hypothetical protein